MPAFDAHAEKSRELLGNRDRDLTQKLTSAVPSLHAEIPVSLFPSKGVAHGVEYGP